MSYKAKIVILILTIISFFLSSNVGIFWDNILFVSKIGGYLYNHNIFNWVLPDNIDPGHPPLLGFIQSLGWKLLGKKLWVSHLVMSPFVFGLLYQLFELVSHYIDNTRHQTLAFILILADPTLLAQLFYVSPEIIQLFFFFMAVNSILKNNIRLKTIALFFLGIVSLRGMILCSGVFIFELSRTLIIQKTSILKFISNSKTLISYFIGSIPALSFILWHYLFKGWFISFPGSPWESTNEIVSFKSFIFNAIVITHRYLDFGRIGIVLFLLIVFYFKREWLRNRTNQELLILSIASVFVIIIISLFIANPIGHRYFIASYISLNLLAFILLTQLKTFKKVIYFILLALLLGGNLWIYPERISQGWDASLAGLPYFKLRSEAIKYLNDQEISIEDVGTFFPNATKISNVDLNDDDRVFDYFDNNSGYVFYSNVYNLNDEEYDLLENRYETVKTFKSDKLYVKILRRK